MVAIGPRVGGAHVNVSLKFDDSSLDTLAQRIRKQLAKIGDSNRKAYQSIGRSAVTAWRSALGAILAGAPLIGGAMSAAAGAIVNLGGALYSLGQSSAALLPIFTSLGIAGFTLSVGLNNFFAAVAETDPKGLQLLLKGMPKQMQAAVLSVRSLNNEMRAALFPKLFAGLSGGIDKLRNTGVIQKGLGSMADSINGVVRSILDYTNTAAGTSVLDKFFQNNAKVFAALGKAVVPFLDAFLRLVNALTPAAIRLAGHITDLAKYFQDLTKADGFGKRINDAMLKAEKTAGKLLHFFSLLGQALANVFGAANGPTNNFLNILNRVVKRFVEFSGSVKGRQEIKKWAYDANKVMIQFGETIRAVFKVIAKLADSRVIISFLTTLEGAFNLLLKLPLDKLVSAYIQIAQKLQPISSALLAGTAGIVAFNIMLGSIAGQVGGLFSVLGRFTGITDIFKNIFGKGGATVGKNAADVSKFTGVLKELAGFLGRALKFAGLAGLAIYIATLISQSKKLQGKVKEVFQAFKDLAGPLKTAFQEISTALKPVSKDLGPVFKFMDKIAGLAIGVVLDIIRDAFKALGNVITGAGRIIAGLLIVLDGLFHLDFSRVLDGLKKMASGVVPLLKGAFVLILTFFAPARFAKYGALAFKGLFKGLVSAVPLIFKAIGRLLLFLGKAFAKLPGLLIVQGRHAITVLSDAFIKYGPRVLDAAGRMVTGILGWVGRLPGLLIVQGRHAITVLSDAFIKYGPRVVGAMVRVVKGVLRLYISLPGRLLLLGRHAITVLSDAFRKYGPRVVAGAARIFRGVVSWIQKLPGRLVELGRHAITVLSDAFRKNGPKVADGARRIFTGVVDWIKKLPGRLVELGRHAITVLSDAFRAGKDRIVRGWKRIGNGIIGVVKGLPGQMLQFGKDIITKLVEGISAGIGKVKDVIGKVTGAIGKYFPGSPVREGPLMAWNYGGGASGGGRNIIDAISGGLSDTDPIRRAMAGVADAVSTSITPRVAVAGVTDIRRTNTQTDTGRAPEAATGGNTYIGTMMPHNYGEFERQIRQKQRLAALGGRAS